MLEPSTYGRLWLSTRIRRPWSSKMASPSRWLSNARWYWKPEQAPPRTPTRSPATDRSASCVARNSRTFCAPVSVKFTPLAWYVICVVLIALPSVATVYPVHRSMPSPEEIKRRIEAAIPESSADVEDWTGGGDHFRATVVSPAFAGLSRIQQHRLVMDVFEGEIGGPIHALSVKTQTP